jgi:tetratricopeptide (TPR) repeat protein
MRYLRLGATVVLVLFVAACRTPAEPLPPMSSVIAEARRLDLAGDQPGAITIFRQALERDEASYQAHYGLARALDLEGHYDEARQHLSRAIELSSDADRDQTLRMMGIAWTFAGRTDEAAGAFKDVFDRRVEAGNMPGAADEANELGRVYLEEYQAALDHLASADDADPFILLLMAQASEKFVRLPCGGYA